MGGVDSVDHFLALGNFLGGLARRRPPRWMSTQTKGSSVTLASPRISVLSEKPGPEVAVMAFCRRTTPLAPRRLYQHLPAQAAPAPQP